MNGTTLVGIKRFISKENKAYATLEVTSPFRAEDVANGCVGYRCEEIFVNEALQPQLASLEVGKPINLDYDIVAGRAHLIGFATVSTPGK